MDGSVRPYRLMVSIPTSPEQRPLPGVVKEISAIEDTTKEAFLHERLAYPCARLVLERVRHCDLVHFACHGLSYPLDPFNSGPVPQDGSTTTLRADPRIVRHVSDANLDRAAIPYLPACSRQETALSG